MKSYTVDYANKTALITKRTTDAEKKMLERLGLTLIQKKEFARPSYRQIEIFLSYLENGLEMMEQFETMRGLSLSEDACYKAVLKWFNDTFPYYGGPYEFNDNHKIVGPKRPDNITQLPDRQTA